ncbi:hypothetical protein F4X10_18520 [Candidatus Poribacteria bacterium]|nr:hypothetical protein [Candidatus Poribacteria bacterium]
MTLPFASRLTLICALIFAILLADVSVATPTKEKNDSSTHEKSRPLIGLPTLVVISVTSFGYWLTPLDNWDAEIRKLTEDELFVQRWMLLNDDPASLEKGKRAIAKIQKERKAIEKKRNRFLWWYYPSMTVIGAGAMMLTLWLQKD